MSAISGNMQNNTIDLNGSMIHITGPEGISELLQTVYALSEKDFILTDTNTARHCLPILKKLFPFLDEERQIIIESGEDEKNISTLHHIWSFLQDAGAGRYSRLINLGGGVVSDIGGLAASTYKRGIEFIHMPTSLMGMADASIGGKTAINLGKVKNQIGLFSLPEAVVIYPGFLDTLPWEEFLSGYAELIKIGLVSNSTLWNEMLGIELIEERRQTIIAQLEEVILPKAIELKAEMVSRDFKDQGERQRLNFGHSIAHALEALYLSKGNQLRHGIAVAAGMVCEAGISTQLSGLSVTEEKTITEYILANYPQLVFEEKDIADIIAFMRHDKKNYEDDIRMSLLKTAGACVYGIPCQEDIIRESLLSYIQHS